MDLPAAGFPKSMNIGLAIDKKNGVESKVIGQNKDILTKQKKDLETGHRKIVDSFNAGANDRNNGFITVSADIKVPVSDIGKKWSGWGTALKPSFESIIVARKPLDGTCIDNVIKWGVGGINIDECRVGNEYIKGGTMPDLRDVGKKSKEAIGIDKLSFGQVQNASRLEYEGHEGRFPANTILTYDDTDFEEVCGGFPNTKKNGSIRNPNLKNSLGNNGIYNKYSETQPLWEAYNDSGSACRYYYNAKASKRDRDEGLDKKNNHPCVKPTSLMQYLVRLVTPKGGTVLDPFMGSGSTGKATAYENNERDANYKFIGIETSKEYCDIAKARIEFAINQKGEKKNE